MTPHQRFMQDYELIKFLPSEQIDVMFLHTQKRRVSLDATISITNITFEVPQRYIKQNINVRYSPDNLNVAYIYDELGNLKYEIHPVDKIANSKAKRNELSFSDMKGED